MREIIWEQCLEKNGRTLFIQIEKSSPSSFTFSEGLMPPGDFPMGPRSFNSEEEAQRYVEEIYLPGRRTYGWTVKEI